MTQLNSKNALPKMLSQQMTLGTSKRRIISIVFPYLPTDRIMRQRLGISWILDQDVRAKSAAGVCDEKLLSGALACCDKQNGTMRVVSLNQKGEDLGLRVLQGVTEACAMCPDLDIVPSDCDADLDLLNALADWADRYTPLIALDAPYGLFLDITGCAHLFGGEAAMMHDMLSRLKALGVHAQAAIAPTAGLAWGLAREHNTSQPAICDAHHIRPTVSGLSIAALRLPREMVSSLQRVGLKMVRDIIDAPRKPLTRRFGPLLLRRLDQALGLEDEPISPRLPIADLSVERRLIEPIISHEHVQVLIDQLATTLRSDMEKRGLSAQSFLLSLFRVDGAVQYIEINLSSPTRDPIRIQALFAERLAMLHDELDIGLGFEIGRLAVLLSVPIDDQQHDFDRNAPIEQAFNELTDRLSMRLGSSCVVKMIPHQSHIPERATSFVPLISASKN